MNYAIIKKCSLKQYNTLRLESIADKVVFPYNATGIREIYKDFKEKKIIILGNGSNILLSKDYYNEDYVFVNFKLMDNIELNGEQISIESGATLSSLSWYAVENNIIGFEFLEDVPGSLGGAIIMNAGTYQDTIGQLIEQVVYYNINSTKIIVDSADSTDFGRRESKWTDDEIIVISCVLTAKKGGNHMESLEKLLATKKNRYMKQPRNYPNAGSVFKRPSLNGRDYYVWKLIDDLGLRGFNINDAKISEKHPGFIINTGNAKYEDVINLINLIKEEVKNNFKISLDLEWKII